MQDILYLGHVMAPEDETFPFPHGSDTMQPDLPFVPFVIFWYLPLLS